MYKPPAILGVPSPITRNYVRSVAVWNRDKIWRQRIALYSCTGLGRLRLKVGQPDRTTPPIIDLWFDLAVESGRTAFGQYADL